MIYFHHLKFLFFPIKFYYDRQNWNTIRSLPQWDGSCVQNTSSITLPLFIYSPVPAFSSKENGTLQQAGAPSRTQGVTQAGRGGYSVIRLSPLCSSAVDKLFSISYLQRHQFNKPEASQHFPVRNPAKGNLQQDLTISSLVPAPSSSQL